MKRHLLFAVMLAMVVVLAGCDNVEVDSPEAGKGVDAPTQSDTSTVPEGMDAMPTDGPGEAAAVAALPGALSEAKKMQEGAGLEWPAVEGITPIFTAYLIAVDMNGQSALFEVRADGIPHSLYAYQKAFDAGTLIWTPSDAASSERRAPQSPAETAAVSAVESAMRDSFPEASFSASVYGYRFVYLKDGAVLLTLEIDSAGSVISAGS